jgi:hypothetical protein
MLRLLAAVFAVCLVAAGQSMNVDRLIAFLKSEERMLKEGTTSDKQLADFLAKVRLTERLDDRTIETLQGTGVYGPKTLEALRALRDKSQSLAASATPVQVEYVQPPPPSSIEQAAIIDHAREYAMAYSKTLPDFICTQVTRRFAAPTQRSRRDAGMEPSWQLLDTLTIKLSYFGQKEDYKLILVNSRPTTQPYESVGGSTSSGDFGTMMKDILDPASNARFEWQRWATLRDRLTMVFSYKVEQVRSQWHVLYERSYDIVPAYHGLVYVDAKTRDVTRVTLVADLPPSFPVDSAETILDYGYMDISGKRFLLPLKSRVNLAAGGILNRNDTEFLAYRKYSAESDIKFDVTETPEPLPDSATKETPPAPSGKKQ